MFGNKQLFKSIFVSGLAVLIGYLISYFLTSYITVNVGIDAYGFVSIAKSFVSYAGIITISLTSFTVRFITISYHENNIKESRGFYSSSITACSVLSLVILAVALIVIAQLEIFLNIPEKLIEPVKLLFVLTFLNFVVSTIASPFGAAAVIKNKLDIVGFVKIISYCCEAIVLIVMFKVFTPTVWFVGIGSLSAALVNLLGNALLTRVLTPDLRFKRKLISFNKVKTLLSHGIYNSINSLGNVLNSGLDLIISNLFLSATTTGEISVVKTLATMFSTLITTVSQPMQPKLIKSYSSGNKDEFVSELKNCMRFCGIFVSILFAGFYALGDLYYKLWLPGENTALLFRLTILTVLMYVTDGIMQPIYYVYTLTLKNKLPCAITIIGGVINVFSMFILLKYTSLGAYAVVGTTTVVMLSINLFFNMNYAANVLSVSSKEFYCVTIKHLISTFVMTICFSFISKIMTPQGWTGLILSAIIMCFTGVIIYFLIMYSKSEKQNYIHKVKHIITKGTHN